jgi:phage/plasmid-like protein (TIGR03299 family)
MTDNIFGTRFAGARVPAWHGLGTVFQEPLTVTEAVAKAGMDYLVTKEPVIVNMKGRTIETDKIALVREPTPDDDKYRIFGYASPDYEIIQNSELAEMVDHLSKRWPTETVGALGYGETTFIVLDAGGADVKGEEIRKYFLISDSKTGGTTLKIAFTPVRVVCQNTLTYGLKNALSQVSLRHYPNLRDEIKFQLDLADQMQAAQDEAMESFEYLAGKEIVEEQVTQILQQAYPEPKRSRRARLAQQVPLDELAKKKKLVESIVKRYNSAEEAHETQVARVKSFRDGAKKLYTNFGESETGGATAGTAWAAWQAVCETEDYRRGGNAEENALFGYRAITKARAYEAALAV